MFLKRSLVMMLGVLLFIGGFLLKFHLADASLENTFQSERQKYGVEGVVLTLSEASPPAPVAPAATMPAADTSAAPSADTTTPPAPAPDAPLIINPTTTDPAPTPAPDPTPAPAPDTNGGPMMPSPSTQNEPRTPWPAMASSRGAALLRWIATSQLAQESTLSSAQMVPATNSAPASVPVATNSSTGATTTSTNPPTPASPPLNGSSTKAMAPLRETSTNKRAIILGYHQFTGPGVGSKNIYSMSQDVFESEMKYLHDNGYHVIPLSDVVSFVKHGTELPPNAVAITIDDGYKSALNYAAPVLKQYGYPWTYFVYPAFITRTEGRGAASWPDLVELGKEGVDVECHSMTHPQLSKHKQLFIETPAASGGAPVIRYAKPYHLLTDQEYDDFLTNETVTAKAELEKELGKKIKYFAYPYGDFNKAVEAKTVAAGYEAIFTVADNPVHITTDIHSIGRYIITKPVERAFPGYLRQGALSLAEVNPGPGATTSNPRPVITAVLGFTGDPASLETEVRDFGVVKHDFDPQTSTVRLYLPRDLIQPEVLVSIRAKDERSGQTVVANWHFNYEPAGGAPAPVHEPIPARPAATSAEPAGESAEGTNGPAINESTTNGAAGETGKGSGTKPK